MKASDIQTRNDPRWTATRALGIDLERAGAQLSALRLDLAGRDVQAARASFAALRSILVRHLLWESGTLADHAGWRPAGGREVLEWSLTTWHDELNRALQEIAGLVGTPSLAIPSAYWALEASVTRLEELLECYGRKIDETYYRVLDMRIGSMSDRDAARMQRAWQEHVAWGPADPR